MPASGPASSRGGPAIAGALIFTVGAGWAFVLDAAVTSIDDHNLALLVAILHAAGQPQFPR